MGMAIEEMAELIQQINKADRKGLLKVQERLVEEYVDATIMLEQMEVILDDHLHSFQAMVGNYRHQKLHRMREMLDEADKNKKCDDCYVGNDRGEAALCQDCESNPKLRDPQTEEKP